MAPVPWWPPEPLEHAGAGVDIGPLTDPLDLLGAWDGADLAIVVDAVRSGAAPGTLRVVDLAGGDGAATPLADPPPARTGSGWPASSVWPTRSATPRGGWSWSG